MTKTIKRMHVRIVIGGVILMVAFFLWFLAGTSFGATVSTRDSGPAAFPVRFAEGSVHGFLDLHTADGALLAHGDLLQVSKDETIESRMIFHFARSVFEETVSFTQRGVFTMRGYHLVQSGPAFAEDIDASIAHSGAYVVKTKSHDSGKEKTYSGTLKLPPDVYNGMVITVAKNLTSTASKTVHIVAFTPEPRIIELELAPSGTDRVLIGTHEEPTSHIVLKPHLGTVLRFFARLKGVSPPDSHVWIVTDQVPAFVRYSGPLFTGPVWRIDLTSPSWPR